MSRKLFKVDIIKVGRKNKAVTKDDLNLSQQFFDKLDHKLNRNSCQFQTNFCSRLTQNCMMYPGPFRNSIQSCSGPGLPCLLASQKVSCYALCLFGSFICAGCSLVYIRGGFWVSSLDEAHREKRRPSWKPSRKRLQKSLTSSLPSWSRLTDVPQALLKTSRPMQHVIQNYTVPWATISASTRQFSSYR